MLESVSESIYTCKHQGESHYNLAVEPVCYKLWNAADGRIFRVKGPGCSAIVHPSLILYVDALQVSLVNVTFARCNFFELSAYKPRPVAHFKRRNWGQKGLSLPGFEWPFLIAKLVEFFLQAAIQKLLKFVSFLPPLAPARGT